jgi:hypothetical protein
MDQVRRLWKEEPAAPQTTLDHLQSYFDLGIKQRLVGTAVFGALGLFFFFMAFSFLYLPRTFLKFYLMGIICAVLSSLFLLGPKRQLQQCMESQRILPVLIFILSTVMAILAVSYTQNLILAVAMVVVQFCAFLWYLLTYIPYGTTAARYLLPV